MGSVIGAFVGIILIAFGVGGPDVTNQVTTADMVCQILGGFILLVSVAVAILDVVEDTINNG